MEPKIIQICENKEFFPVSIQDKATGKESEDMRRVTEGGAENERCESRLLRGPFWAQAGTVGKDASLNFSCDEPILAACDPVSTKQIHKWQTHTDTLLPKMCICVLNGEGKLWNS